MNVKQTKCGSKSRQVGPNLVQLSSEKSKTFIPGMVIVHNLI